LAGTKKASKVGSGKRRSLAPSAPDVKVGYSTAGRETLAAIEEELAAPAISAAEAPLIEISETPAGRETMAAIAEELSQAARPRLNTLPYGDRISNAPGARLPSAAPAARDSTPEIIMGVAEDVAPARPPASAPRPAPSAPRAAPAPQAAPDALEIFELLTFIVRGNKVGDLSSDALRRRFVAEHLIHRVPGQSLDNVERIEVTPWTAKGTMVVRVWCKS
jgi:hypothetical protein